MGRAPIAHRRWAAFHEAGHAMARFAVGATITHTVIHADGTGLSHGTGQKWAHAHGQYLAWDRLVVLLAGAFAEARVRRCSPALVYVQGGKGDFVEAKTAIAWLVEHRYSESSEQAWRRAEEETRQMVRQHWSVITAVANTLMEQGALSPEGLQQIITKIAGTAAEKCRA